MNSARHLLGTLLLTFTAVVAQASPLGTAFTYLGRLNDGGSPATGLYDLRFAAYDTGSGGSQVGLALTNSAVGVTNGLLTVSLDFGATVFDGAARWLEVGVRPNGGGAFTTLTPRQPLTPAPYALFAPNAGAAASAATATTANSVANNAVIGASIAGGHVVKNLNGLRDAVALAAGPNVSLATNANTLTISAAGGGASGGWSTTGNAGTAPAANFLGTTDGHPLMLQAGNVGINTNNPQATLHVNGTALATRFAGDGSGLTNVPATLATPFTLTNLAITNNGDYAYGVAVSGHYAYLANFNLGLYVYDVSDPAHPIQVGHEDIHWAATAVAVSGHYAFVAGDRLNSVDISSPASPVTVGYATGSYYCYGVAVSGNVAYLAADADGLFTYNISNPAKPTSLGHINNGGKAQGVAVSGNFAYLANDTDGLRIYNVANPAAPVPISRIYNNPARVHGVAVSGNFAYLANDTDGLRIYNVANPTNPISKSQIFDGGYAYGVAVSGRYAFVANYGDGLRVYDVSDPTRPVSVGAVPLVGDGFTRAVAASGNYAYTANDSGGLWTFFAAPLASVPGVVGAAGFLGDGSSLTNLNATQLVGQVPPSALGGAWQLGGNAGTTPGVSFLGTSDNKPLELRVNSESALRLGTDGSLALSTNSASGIAAVALGNRTTASRDAATALGSLTIANGGTATAMGYKTMASGNASTAMGNETSASGQDATAMGSKTSAGGFYSTAMGVSTATTGDAATAMGDSTAAAGYAATAMGYKAWAYGDYSTAMGYETYAIQGRINKAT